MLCTPWLATVRRWVFCWTPFFPGASYHITAAETCRIVASCVKRLYLRRRHPIGLEAACIPVPSLSAASRVRRTHGQCPQSCMSSHDSAGGSPLPLIIGLLLFRLRPSGCHSDESGPGHPTILVPRVFGGTTPVQPSRQRPLGPARVYIFSTTTWFARKGPTWRAKASLHLAYRPATRPETRVGIQWLGATRDGRDDNEVRKRPASPCL